MDSFQHTVPLNLTGVDLLPQIASSPLPACLADGPPAFLSGFLPAGRSGQDAGAWQKLEEIWDKAPQCKAALLGAWAQRARGQGE